MSLRFVFDEVKDAAIYAETEKRDNPLFFRHLYKYVRNFLPSSTSNLLTLDGHKSRIGFEWFELCQNTTVKLFRHRRILHIFSKRAISSEIRHSKEL